MPVGTDAIGKPTGAHKVRVQRGPLEFFARALFDDNPVYHDVARARAAGFANLPAPPTFSLAMAHMGAAAEEQPGGPTPGGNSLEELMEELMSMGGLILHGEQQFEYHRPIVVGDVLVGEGRIADVYERESKSAVMTFIVMETVWRDEVSGEPVVTERLNLIHRLDG
jgi:acyl dehydratase